MVDICRQTIIFEHLSSLAECIRVISLDREARVVRVKNRFDPSYNAAFSAGYRDLALNLTLESNETIAMGLEKHVCELQLMLLPMCQLKVFRDVFDFIDSPCHLTAKIVSPIPVYL